MAILIQGRNIADVWEKLLGQILMYGKEVSPRNMPTKEITNVTIEVENGLDNVLLSKTRDLNYRFMIAEWLWIQAGLDSLGYVEKYNSIMRNYSDDGIHLAGAYGPRLRYQWRYIFENLNKPFSRQAVASIWTPNPQESKDIPCTLNLQWLIREDVVNCTINMRSSDVWLGLPYDFFGFSQLTNVVAMAMKKKVGSVVMNLASSHLYSQHYGVAETTLLYNKILSTPSPLFNSNVNIPASEDIEEMLNNPGEVHGLKWPWNRYAKALEFNKSVALEVLIELSSK